MTLRRCRSVSLSSILVLVAVAAHLHAGNQAPSVKAVRDVDYHKMTGTWYEIARLPNPRQEGYSDVSISFEIDGDKIRAFTRGFKQRAGGRPATLKAAGDLPPAGDPARLKFRFCGIFSFVYQIIDIDKENYEHFMAADEKGECLWFFSREPQMPEETYAQLVESALRKGFDLSKLTRTPQSAARLAQDVHLGR
ncbi:MAG: hypothetical protein GF331_13430 [Chitinivibrionales bacterium]|nr:hypothetical protein [Chitinivibrionales bacterium]